MNKLNKISNHTCKIIKYLCPNLCQISITLIFFGDKRNILS